MEPAEITMASMAEISSFKSELTDKFSVPMVIGFSISEYFAFENTRI